MKLTALAALALFCTMHVPAQAMDSVRDCATFGPHSIGCRATVDRLDRPRVAEGLRREELRRREERWRREHEHRLRGW